MQHNAHILQKVGTGSESLEVMQWACITARVRGRGSEGVRRTFPEGVWPMVFEYTRKEVVSSLVGAVGEEGTLSVL